MFGCGAAVEPRKVSAGIASVFPESKFLESRRRNARAGRKSCFAVLSLAAGVRWPRLPRKVHPVNACRTANILVPRAAPPRTGPKQHEPSPRQRIGPARALIGRY